MNAATTGDAIHVRGVGYIKREGDTIVTTDGRLVAVADRGAWDIYPCGSVERARVRAAIETAGWVPA